MVPQHYYMYDGSAPQAMNAEREKPVCRASLPRWNAKVGLGLVVSAVFCALSDANADVVPTFELRR